jgi:Predicted membrane protein (DUF2232)
MRPDYLVGAGAGLVAALLFGSAAAAPPLAGILFYLAPLPLCLAGLGWGTTAAVMAASVATFLLGMIIGPVAGLVFALALGAPIAALCHLLLLSRRAPIPAGPGEAPIEWYPPGRLVGWAALMAGGLALLMVAALGFDAQSFRNAIATFLHSHAMKQFDPDGSLLTNANIAKLSEVLARALPAAFAAIWLSISLFNLWIAGLIARASGRVLRPWPHLAELELPNGFFLAFVAALACSFLPGTLGLIATGFAGALFLGFMLQGLAVVHAATRGMPFRGPLLVSIYIGIALLGWVAIIVAIVGLAEPLLNLRGRAAKTPPPNH